MKSKLMTMVLVVFFFGFTASVALAELCYSEDFSQTGGGVWWARNGTEGWYAPYGYSATGAIYAGDNSNTLPGMSGEVAYGGYVSATIGIGIHLVSELADQLSAGNIVSVEASLASRGGNCAGAAAFGFVTNGTVVQNGSWQEIQTGGTILAGIKWGSRYAGVTTLETFMGSDVAGESFDVQYDNVVRQKLSLDPTTDKKKLEMKRYVNGAWEQNWTTVFDWTSAGMDLSVANVNGVYLELGIESGKQYEADDLNVMVDTYVEAANVYVEPFNSSAGAWSASGWSWNDSNGNPGGCFLGTDCNGEALSCTKTLLPSSGQRKIVVSFEAMNPHADYEAGYSGSYSVDFADGTTRSIAIPVFFPPSSWATTTCTTYVEKDITKIHDIGLYHSYRTQHPGSHWDAIDNFKIKVFADSASTTWDAVTGFSENSDPNGQWEYGYRASYSDAISEDFSQTGGGAWWARQGTEGWYAPYGYSAPGAILCQDNNNTMSGMSGEVAYGGYVSATIGMGIHLVSGLADQLSAGNIVSVEASLASRGGNCQGAGLFGFVINGTVVQNGSWQEIQTDSAIVSGIKWGSRYAGVTTLESFMGNNVAGESFDVQYNNVVRQKLSLDPTTDKEKLEMKRYVNGAWEQNWTTVLDWTNVGMDLSAANVNGVYLELGIESGKQYELDDLSLMSADTVFSSHGTISMGGNISPANQYGGWYLDNGGSKTPNVGRTRQDGVTCSSVALPMNKLQMFGYSSGSMEYEPWVKWTAPARGIYSAEWSFKNLNLSGTWSYYVKVFSPQNRTFWSKKLFYNPGSDANGSCEWRDMFMESGDEIYFLMEPSGSTTGDYCSFAATVTRSTMPAHVSGKQWVRGHPFTLYSWMEGNTSYDWNKIKEAGLNSYRGGIQDSNYQSLCIDAKNNGLMPTGDVLSVDYYLTDAVKSAINAVSDSNSEMPWYIIDEPPLGCITATTQTSAIAAWLRVNRPYAPNYCNLFAWDFIWSALPGDQPETFPRYWTLVKPDIMMMDCYPFAADGTCDYDSFFLTLCAARLKSLTADVPQFNWIQNFIDPYWTRWLSESEVRMQVYASLAAGVKGLGWFKYDDIPDINMEGGYLGWDGSDGEMRAIDAVINDEIAILGPVLLFQNSTEFRFIPGWNGSSYNSAYTGWNFSNWTSGAGGNFRITSITVDSRTDSNQVRANNNFAIGFFNDDIGRQSFMIVNTCCDANLTPAQLALGVTIQFNSSVDYIYRLNRTTGIERIALTNHAYHLSLDGGSGDLYSFGDAPAPGKATSPSPANSTTNISVTADLSWTAGNNTTSHNVYFGTDSTPDETEYKGNQVGTTYDPGTLAYGTTYYWRIDEFGNGNGGITTGDVWSFTTTGPTFVAAGAVTSGTGTIIPSLPASITTGDILLLFIETSNQAVSISNQNGGTWTQITSSPQGTGTAAGTTGARLTAYWSRYNGTQGNPTVSDSGDHQMSRIIAIRGAVSSDNPWDVTAGGVEAVSDTSGSIPGATTTVGNTLVVTAIATSLPDSTSTTRFSGWTNANLTSVTERTDNSVAAGNGGGIGVATGIKATAGAYGNTAVTLASSAYKGMMSIAIKP